MNTRTRNRVRRQFVLTNREKIKQLIDQYSGTVLYTKPIHPIRAWIESIRVQAGYKYNAEWRSIWFTFQKDYQTIQNGWTPQNSSTMEKPRINAAGITFDITEENYLSFRKAYRKAIQNKEAAFNWQGMLVEVPFAYYCLEYMETFGFIKAVMAEDDPDE